MENINIKSMNMLPIKVFDQGKYLLIANLFYSGENFDRMFCNNVAIIAILTKSLFSRPLAGSPDCSW